MEKEGLYRVVEFLQNSDITLEVLVTDRHKQINKWLREKHPEIIHYRIAGMFRRLKVSFFHSKISRNESLSHEK